MFWFWTILTFAILLGIGAAIEKAGRQYAESGEIEGGLLKEICSPMIPDEVYAEIVNGTVN